MIVTGMLHLPRFHFAGWKSFRPTVCLARIGIRYERLVPTVAAAVSAEKATYEPMTAALIAIERTTIKMQALTGR